MGRCAMAHAEPGGERHVARTRSRRGLIPPHGLRTALSIDVGRASLSMLSVAYDEST